MEAAWEGLFPRPLRFLPASLSLCCLHNDASSEGKQPAQATFTGSRANVGVLIPAPVPNVDTDMSVDMCLMTLLIVCLFTQPGVFTLCFAAQYGFFPQLRNINVVFILKLFNYQFSTR